MSDKFNTQVVAFDRRDHRHVAALVALCRDFVNGMDVDGQPARPGITSEVLREREGKHPSVNEVGHSETWLVLNLTFPLELAEELDELGGESVPKDEIVEASSLESQITGSARDVLADVDERAADELRDQVEQLASHGKPLLSGQTETIAQTAEAVGKHDRPTDEQRQTIEIPPGYNYIILTRPCDLCGKQVACQYDQPGDYERTAERIERFAEAARAAREAMRNPSTYNNCATGVTEPPTPPVPRAAEQTLMQRAMDWLRSWRV